MAPASAVEVRFPAYREHRPPSAGCTRPRRARGRVAIAIVARDIGVSRVQGPERGSFTRDPLPRPAGYGRSRVGDLAGFFEEGGRFATGGLLACPQ